jgi:hypothetical protein
MDILRFGTRPEQNAPESAETTRVAPFVLDVEKAARRCTTSSAIGKAVPAIVRRSLTFSRHCYFQGVTGGTLSVAGGMSTVLKSAGLTISMYSMSGE